MAKPKHKGKRKAVKTAAHKVARRSASVMKPEYLAEIERFRLMDDDFMSKCLENAPECIELMLRIILGKKDLKVIKSQTEYPIKSLQGRGVRFDVFARDSKGREYDIEIQLADKGAEPKRARYNSALMDANALKSGEDVDKLRDTYVIFITENDVLGGGREVYHVNRKIEESDCGDFGDGTHVIYVNCTAKGDSDVCKLIHDLLCHDVDEMYFGALRERVSEFKKSEEGRRVMCKAMERIKAEGVAEGEARGKREGKRENMIETAKRLLANGKLMLKEIAECSGLSLAQVKKLQASTTS